MKHWNEKPSRLPEYRGPLPLWCKVTMIVFGLLDLAMLAVYIWGPR